MQKLQTRSTYNQAFYDETLITSLRSAAQIVPLVLELIPVDSVVDFGCGTGSFLSLFKRHGAKTVLGLDASAVDTRVLQIDSSEIRRYDLTQPINLDRRFDLSMSLEVAEHLPEWAADQFVRSLASASSLVLFSAAVPFQGGTNHINEQWPEYWEKKFRDCGYVAVDCLRERIWQNDEVAYWYAQNILMFVKADELHNYPRLLPYAEKTNPAYLSRIHPKMYLKSRESLANPLYMLMRWGWNMMPRALRVAMIKNFGQNFWHQVNTKYHRH